MPAILFLFDAASEEMEGRERERETASLTEDTIRDDLWGEREGEGEGGGVKKDSEVVNEVLSVNVNVPEKKKEKENN